MPKGLLSLATLHSLGELVCSDSSVALMGRRVAPGPGGVRAETVMGHVRADAERLAVAGKRGVSCGEEQGAADPKGSARGRGAAGVHTSMRTARERRDHHNPGLKASLR